MAKTKQSPSVNGLMPYPQTPYDPMVTTLWYDRQGSWKLRDLPSPHHKYPLPAPYGYAPGPRSIRSSAARRVRDSDRPSPTSRRRQGGQAGARDAGSPDARDS